DDTHEMLSSVMQLKQNQVQEVMIPRTEFSAIAADSNLNQAIGIITEKGFSRYPIFHDNLDQVIGILHAKDILKHLDQDLNQLNLREIMRPVYFVPETKKVSELLQEFRTKGIHIAIAVDEYGGTSGLVTISDLVEEIIGKIYEENLPIVKSEDLIEKLDDGTYLVNGKTEIEEIEELFAIEIEHRGKFESVGGLAVFLSGSIPLVGEHFTYNNLSLTVAAADKRRVKKVRLQLLTETGDANEVPENDQNNRNNQNNESEQNEQKGSAPKTSPKASTETPPKTSTKTKIKTPAGSTADTTPHPDTDSPNR
ncbi:MAG: HlyC/CorC family transporter, partial [Deltaproteobacteria bacterium]|nr:HlyC/CorC family transporter [Deltaproteobacteria bacterium]